MVEVILGSIFMFIMTLSVAGLFYLFTVLLPALIWEALHPLHSAQTSSNDDIKHGEKLRKRYQEFLDATSKLHVDQGMYLNEYILRLMQKNSDEFNQVAGHQARVQFILEVLEFKPEFGDENLFQKAFVSAMNMYVPSEMKKRTGKGGLGMTYSQLSLNEEFTKAKEQQKLLTKV
jgi:hypothetical protein